jgi:PPOX class probable F420-dependent enzyme
VQNGLAVVTVPESARAVLESDAVAHLVTLNPDGSPQVTCIWVGLDGDEIVSGHLIPQQKLRNVRRDPRVTLSLETPVVNPHGLADWIERGYEGLMPLGWYYSDPGAKFNSSHVKGALDHRLNTEMLFPVYRNTRGGGANFEYEVVGWAGYVITSYEIQGSKSNKLLGYFTSVVWEGIGSETAGAPDFGAHVLSLVE